MIVLICVISLLILLTIISTIKKVIKEKREFRAAQRFIRDHELLQKFASLFREYKSNNSKLNKLHRALHFWKSSKDYDPTASEKVKEIETKIESTRIHISTLMNRMDKIAETISKDEETVEILRNTEMNLFRKLEFYIVNSKFRKKHAKRD